MELRPPRVGPAFREGTSQTQPPTVKNVRMARSVELKQPPVFLAKVVNTVHLPQPSARIAQRERSRSSQMIHVLTAKMVSGAPWDPLCALIVNLDAFGATRRLVVPVALQEL